MNRSVCLINILWPVVYRYLYSTFHSVSQTEALSVMTGMTVIHCVSSAYFMMFSFLQACAWTTGIGGFKSTTEIEEDMLEYTRSNCTC